MRGRCVAGLCALAFCVSAEPALAGVANAGIPGAPVSNPIAGLPWGVYDGPSDEVFPAYRAAQGNQRRLLGLIALRPRVRWFGSWYSNPRHVAQRYIADSTHGNPDVLSQMAVFRMEPWEKDACQRLPTTSEQASYKRWIDAFAAGIGNARVALVLQPDLPFAGCAPHHSQLPLQLIAYAARRFNALAHTTVYIDAGSADWLFNIQNAVRLLRGAGVRYARGFAVNVTHYDATASEIRYGARVVRALARAGVPGRHFVVNTADNGRGFTYQQFHGPDFGNATVCRTRASRRCVTLGIPPTTKVADPRWRLPAKIRAAATRYCDGYLWIGRPWLYKQAWPFLLQRSLQLARTTPF